jgi:hypothetical protein
LKAEEAYQPDSVTVCSITTLLGVCRAQAPDGETMAALGNLLGVAQWGTAFVCCYHVLMLNFALPEWVEGSFD